MFYLTTKQAADRLGVTPFHVRRLIHSGKLHAILIGTRGTTYSYFYNKGDGKPRECRGGSVYCVDPESVEQLKRDWARRDMERAKRALERTRRRREFFELRKLGRQSKIDRKRELRKWMERASRSKSWPS